jgi:CBS domain-containing protein
MSIRSYARRSPCTARAEETVREGAKRMEAYRVGCLVVVDERQRPVGIVTDRDVVMRVLRRRRDPDRTTVGQIMHVDLATVREDEDVERAVRAMRREGVRRVPVVDDDGLLTGIFTSDDALQLLSSELAALAQAVRAQFPPDPAPGQARPAHGG